MAHKDSKKKEMLNHLHGDDIIEDQDVCKHVCSHHHGDDPSVAANISHTEYKSERKKKKTKKKNWGKKRPKKNNQPSKGVVSDKDKHTDISQV